MPSMTVVAGVDGSAESMRAAEWAARGAKRHRAPMRLVSAAATPPSTHERGGLSRAVADELRGESVRALRDAAARMEEDLPRLPVSAGLLTGPPALGVTASGSRALMLVVGARGAGGFAAMRLGWLPAATWRSADAELLAADADSSLAEALAPWRDKYPDVPVRRDVLHDHPGHVLASYSGCADLVVIGRDDSAAGGILHALLDNAHGPVAVVPRHLTLVPVSTGPMA